MKVGIASVLGSWSRPWCQPRPEQTVLSLQGSPWAGSWQLLDQVRNPSSAFFSFVHTVGSWCRTDPQWKVGAVT